MTAAKPKPEPAEDEVPALPAVGTVVRLDDPEQDGTPSYALVVSKDSVIRLGHASTHELKTFPAE